MFKKHTSIEEAGIQGGAAHEARLKEKEGMRRD
jgi:hypothetical protein